LAAEPSIGRASLVEAPHVAPHAAATHGLYERHAAKIQSYCQHQLGSREEAEDAVQTTFINAFRALGRGVVPEAESAWLFKIAENVCLSRRRSSWRRGRIESPSDFGVIEEIVPGPNRQHDELIGIEDALASMPEQQRRAILLREWQGLSYREVAEELEISQSAVETLIFRARRSLAQGLEQPEQAKPKRKSFRRALHALDFGTLVAAVKTALAGSAAVKATAVAVAVTAAAGTAATVGPKLEPRSPELAAAPKHVLAVPAGSTASAAAPASFAPVASKVSAPATAEQARVQRLRERTSGPLAPAPESVPNDAPALAAAPVAVAGAPAEPVAEQAPPVAEPQTEPEPQAHPQEPAAQPTPAHASAAHPTAAQPTAAETHAPKSKDEGKSDKQRRTEAVTAPTLPALVAAQVASSEAKSSSGRGGSSKRSGAKLDAIVADAQALLATLTPAATPPDPQAVTAPVEQPTTSGPSEGKDRSRRGGDSRRSEATLAAIIAEVPALPAPSKSKKNQEPVAVPAIPPPVAVPVAPVSAVVTQPVKPTPSATPSQQFPSNGRNGRGK
jgi:RNA polymerase sigma factor (sigma-70 family)